MSNFSFSQTLTSSLSSSCTIFFSSFNGFILCHHEKLEAQNRTHFHGHQACFIIFFNVLEFIHVIQPESVVSFGLPLTLTPYTVMRVAQHQAYRRHTFFSATYLVVFFEIA